MSKYLAWLGSFLLVEMSTKTKLSWIHPENENSPEQTFVLREGCLLSL